MPVPAPLTLYRKTPIIYDSYRLNGIPYDRRQLKGSALKLLLRGHVVAMTKQREITKHHVHFHHGRRVVDTDCQKSLATFPLVPTEFANMKLEYLKRDWLNLHLNLVEITLEASLCYQEWADSLRNRFDALFALRATPLKDTVDPVALDFLLNYQWLILSNSLQISSETNQAQLPYVTSASLSHCMRRVCPLLFPLESREALESQLSDTSLQLLLSTIATSYQHEKAQLISLHTVGPVYERIIKTACSALDSLFELAQRHQHLVKQQPTKHSIHP